MDPLVSIIINNYNYGRYIRQAIESALGQTYKNTELIIVDDGSTDGSRGIIEEYKDRAIVIAKENGGQASAFNVGIMKAKGDFILLLDSDDYLFPEAVQVCVNEFPEGYSRVYYRLQSVDENSKPIPQKQSEGVFQAFDGDVFSTIAESGSLRASPTSGNVFDARKLKATLPIPEKEYRICADCFIFVRTALEGSVRSIDRELGAYRIHRDNNFGLPYGLLLDEKRLKTHVDNIYKSTHLIELACKRVGIDYIPRIFDKSFFALCMLCAAYRMKLDSPHVCKLTRKALLSQVVRYVRFGEAHPVKRIPQSICLLLVMVLPGKLARQLLRLMDVWKHR